ncbi:hypothetical protein MCETHM1_03161 [Flavobacteriaceae bacterium]
MNVKILLILSFLVCQFSFSQSEKLLKGVVSSENFLLKNVDIINKTTKKSTTTNEKGEFVIEAKVNDSLLIYAKDYNLNRLRVSPKLLELNNLQIIMLKNVEELEEVVIEKKQNLKLSKDKKYEQSKRDEYATEKFDNREGYQKMRKGTFVNGLNFVTIRKKLKDLLSKEKEPEKVTLPEIEFATLAKNTCDQKFFTESLKLKPDEIELFLQYCDVDPKSKILNSSSNELSIMDFLIVKNAEYRKKPTSK